jgi:hypothetical protein
MHDVPDRVSPRMGRTHVQIPQLLSFLILAVTPISDVTATPAE